MEHAPQLETKTEIGRYRTLDFGTLLTGSFGVYKKHFGPLIAFFALLNLPPLMVMLYYAFVVERLRDPQWWVTGGVLPSGVGWTELALAGFGLLVYYVLIYPFMLIVPARLAGKTLMAQDVTIKECVDYTRRHWWDTQSAYALFGGIVIALYLLPLMVSMLVLVPGMEIGGTTAAMIMLLLVSFAFIYLLFRVVPLSGAVAFDRPAGNMYHRARSRLVHAFRLSRGNYWYVVGVMLVTWILMYLAREVLIQPVILIWMLLGMWLDQGEVTFWSLGLWQPPLWVLSGQMVMQTLGNVLVVSFEYIVAALLYFDLRFKAEGLDLTLNLARTSEPEPDPEQVVGENTTF
jgi:hypothetical protein